MCLIYNFEYFIAFLKTPQDLTEGANDAEILLRRGVFVMDVSHELNHRHFGIGSRCLFGIANIKMVQNKTSLLHMHNI